MKREPKKGDLIKVYDGAARYVGGVTEINLLNDTLKFYNPKYGANYPNDLWFSFKQCRFIKPIRSVWCFIPEKGLIISSRRRPQSCQHDDPSHCTDNCWDKNYVEFIERRKKK